MKVDDLVKETMKLSRDGGQEGDRKAKEQALKRSLRRFTRVKEVEDFIGNAIRNNMMTDFGSVLKG